MTSSYIECLLRRVFYVSSHDIAMAGRSKLARWGWRLPSYLAWQGPFSPGLYLTFPSNFFLYLPFFLPPLIPPPPSCFTRQIGKMFSYLAVTSPRFTESIEPPLL